VDPGGLQEHEATSWSVMLHLMVMDGGREFF